MTCPNQGRDCPHCLEASRAAVLWLIAPFVAALRFVRLLPARLDLEYLRWARSHLTKHNPMHPDLPEIVRQIRKLEEACRA